MLIEFSIEQMESLIQQIFLSEWVLLAGLDQEEYTESRFYDLTQYIYGQAFEAGISDSIKKEAFTGEFYLQPEERERNQFQEMLEDHIDDIFWSELIHRLATRDFERHYGENAIQAMAIEEREEKIAPFVEKYANEIDKNGLDNLRL